MAISTGGVFGKLAGRVGDTPIPGSGFWADQNVAVACTGQGELFLRTTAAIQVAHRIRWASQNVDQATRSTFEEIGQLGGYGGIVAVDAAGNFSLRTVGALMRYAVAEESGRIASGII